jgi:hypothetical protein
MTIRRFVYGAFGATFLATGLMISSAAPASARCVGPNISGNPATGRLRILVERRARLNWTARARSLYGGQFSNWYVAQNRNLTCTRIRPSNNWHCIGRGRACNRAT